MRRVVVTGLGIVSSIGNNASEVLESLKAGRSGITANEDMKEYGFRSQIAGDIKGLNLADMIDKRTLRFHGARCGLCLFGDGTGDRRCGFGSILDFKRTHRIGGRIRWPVNQFDVRGPSGCVKGRIAQTHWATCGSKMHVLDHFGEPINRVTRLRASTIPSPRPVPHPCIVSVMRRNRS